jgi:hypothetical protein
MAQQDGGQLAAQQEEQLARMAIKVVVRLG